MVLLAHDFVTHMYTVVQVSFVLRTYSGTEGVGLQSLEVCLQIVHGAIDKSTSPTVNVLTVSQTAIGMLLVPV